MILLEVMQHPRDPAVGMEFKGGLPLRLAFAGKGKDFIAVVVAQGRGGAVAKDPLALVVGRQRTFHRTHVPQFPDRLKGGTGSTQLLAGDPEKIPAGRSWAHGLPARARLEREAGVAGCWEARDRHSG